MSGFTTCGNCGANMGRGADECPQCGHPMFAKDRQVRGQGQDRRNLAEEQALLCADYERKHFELMPRQEDETVADFVKRIDRQKTPLILAEHRVLLARLEANPKNNLNLPRLPARAREPGDDDQEAHSEQAA